MDRRNFSSACLAVSGAWALMAMEHAHALSLGSLSASDASNGVKAALEKGATVAVGLLGRPDGFLANPRVRIPLPGSLDKAVQMLRMVGQGDRIDELVTAMNRAAEQAIPASKDLLIDAVRSMTVSDAKGVLTGGATSVTDFFVGKTRVPLTERFLPIVTTATARVQLEEKYNRIAGKASGMGLMKAEDANLQRYVTGKSLDGLYLAIGDEERKIRQDPVGSGSAVLQKVFGALQ
ncbi:MAG: DUF4197 domain-containing protein [Janthinobacterium lividum]